jgi:hypothetical protein
MKCVPLVLAVVQIALFRAEEALVLQRIVRTALEEEVEDAEDVEDEAASTNSPHFKATGSPFNNRRDRRLPLKRLIHFMSVNFCFVANKLT